MLAKRSIPFSCFGSRSIESQAYNFSEIESKWQEKWKHSPAKKIDNQLGPDHGPKYYVLSMFPYPSGRLHMGHVRVYTISDTLARYHHMKGSKILHPMGWDSFGLPAENAAIDRGVSPVEWTNQNIEIMRAQLNTLGCQFDWNRELSTCSPQYYCWTQWLFLQLYRHGLAYKKRALVNWDPVDQTVLANEQVDTEGYSWRSGAKVERKYLNQWFLKISDYAEELLRGLDEVDWSDSVKELQRSWIGKSEGAFFQFNVQGADTIKVFTTRPDTIYGVSFLAVSLEHDLLRQASLESSVLQQLHTMRNSSTLTSRKKDDKKGVNLGITAVHPLTGKEIPIFAAEYVLSDYGTKAVMGVPGHDERDLLFAKDHCLPVITVVDTEKNVLCNCDKFTGLSVSDGAEAILNHASSLKVGGHMTHYKLRDWLISRQRYWGTPIPVMYCKECGVVPVAEDELPVKLPENIHLSGRGPSPLAQSHDWQHVSCGKPGCCARRETDTIDTFVDSSWYFLRYINPTEVSRPFTEDVLKWMPVDIYIGGIEHANLHLLYARFITHFLHNLKLLKTREPFQKLLTQGMVQGKTYRETSSGRYLTKEEQASLAGSREGLQESWEKMSKSKHNGVDPQEVIQQYGADTVRLFMLFKAPPEMDIQWDVRAIRGNHRWLNRVWLLCHDHANACKASDPVRAGKERREQLFSVDNVAIKQMTHLLDQHSYNVAVAELMIFFNKLKGFKDLKGTVEYHQSLSTLCTLLSPLAPHIASELWEMLNEAGQRLNLPKSQTSVLEEKWPSWNEDLILPVSNTVVFQVNGIKKGSFLAPQEICKPLDEDCLKALAVQVALKQHIITGTESVQKIFIAPSGQVINFVVKE